MKRLFICLIVVLWAPFCHGGLAAYLQLQDIAGESQDDGYEEWIDITGIKRAGRSDINIGSIQSVAKYTPQAVKISLGLPGGYSKMADYLTTGTRVELRLTIVSTTGASGTQPIQTYIFHNCLISQLLLEGNGEAGPVASLSFVYERMEWEVSKLAGDGRVIVLGSLEYDLFKNQITYDIPSGGGTPSTDNDSDGMPNSWENLYGLNPESGADRNADPDLDGFSNYLEYLAGTHPKQFTSHLKIIQLTLPNGGSGARLEWSSVPGKSYRVQRASSGLNNADWTTLDTVSASGGASTTYTLPATGLSKVFYRVVLVP